MNRLVTAFRKFAHKEGGRRGCRGRVCFIFKARAGAAALFILLNAAACFGHPMGNLSVNHYARLEPGAQGVDVLYVLDLAEIPTFELTQQWNLPASSPKDVLERRATRQAREWISNLAFTANGKPVTASIASTSLAIVDGAGNLPVFRIATKLHVNAASGRFEYEDRNYPSRAGWREVVIQAGSGAGVVKASNGGQDISEALTSYPQDPTKAPPQDTKAWLEWKAEPGLISSTARPTATKAMTPPAPAIQSQPVPVARDVRPPEAQAAGVIKRNDSISQILRMKTISWPVMFTLIGIAFWFGALHALEPGHGKTMVAAYLVGERGNARHAVWLGGIVTFTHTISVFLLGLATIFLSRYVMPDRISKVLGILSGLSIVWIGGMLLLRRARALKVSMPHAAHGHHHGHDHDHHHHAHDHGHHHGHHHDHDHVHVHDHPHEHDHHHPHEHAHHHGSEAHQHAHGAFTHTHDGHTHSHAPAEGISMKTLLALGASGGMVPCPSALILLLSAISIGRPGLGMILLVAFSLGLALVLTSTGLLVLYAKNLLPEKKRTNNLVFRYVPVFSAATIVVIGVVMTTVSLGWTPANRLF